MKRRTLAIILSISLLLPVQDIKANELELASDSEQEQEVAVGSCFTVPEEDEWLLNNVVVSIPASLDLKETSTTFETTKNISASGVLTSDYMLSVSINNQIEYTGIPQTQTQAQAEAEAEAQVDQNQAHKVYASTEFGTTSEDDGMNTEVWTSEQLDGTDEPDERPLTIRINKSQVKSGTAYTGEIVFNIKVQKQQPEQQDTEGQQEEGNEQQSTEGNEQQDTEGQQGEGNGQQSQEQGLNEGQQSTEGQQSPEQGLNEEQPEQSEQPEQPEQNLSESNESTENSLSSEPTERQETINDIE